jgi:hypothetical protein
LYAAARAGDERLDSTEMRQVRSTDILVLSDYRETNHRALACCAETNSGYRVDTIGGSIPDQEGIPAVDALLFGPKAMTMRADVDQPAKRRDFDFPDVA